MVLGLVSSADGIPQFRVLPSAFSCLLNKILIIIILIIVCLPVCLLFFRPVHSFTWLSQL